ncbi:Hypothetical protein PHPALM_14397 [Phytophthora palmivora]|uniref:PiggyBac transposable element-derived protein domain-containing protein n=1 Tax=Phytophthora palmivora TaxID=4796 RepID=A0A2P4XV25_9STRA|nr:Hypothetical protein PHPALM_14397 [Phytophthora palmivora]
MFATSRVKRLCWNTMQTHVLVLLLPTSPRLRATPNSLLLKSFDRTMQSTSKQQNHDLTSTTYSDDTAIPDNDSVSEYSSSDPEHEHDAEEVDVVTRGTALLADTLNNLNTVDGCESAQIEYESEDSSDEDYVPEDVVDDPRETEEEVVAEVCLGENFLEGFGGEDRMLAGNLQGDVLKSMSASGWEDVMEDDIYEYLMAPYEPHIAACSNEYQREMLPDRVDGAYQRYRKKRRRDTELPRKTRRDIQHDMETMKPVVNHELCRFVGLLVARTIAPNREKLSNHWKTQHVDRALKIHKVVEVLQRTFAQGYVCPSHLAFDEAFLPSRSSFNKMRVYMKDKPHKLGYCKEVIEKKKTRPSSILRGFFIMASDIDRVVCQDGADQVEVPCPRVIKDYHAFMGGVDVHDQLRLQRYSLQRAVRFKKYYKFPVLVLIDLVIVNGYIIHKAYHKNKESRPLTHVKYMIKLHLQRCQPQTTDMYEGNTSRHTATRTTTNL